MAQPTPSQIKDRLVTMCAAISGITTSTDKLPEDSFPFTAAELPAIVVTIGPASNTAVAGNLMVQQREFGLILLAARFPKDWKITNQATWEAVEPFTLSIPLHFKRNSRLEHNDSGLAVAITLPSEQGNGLTAFAFDNGLYAATIFSLQVRTNHS
jgi:hypothetical protein